MFDSRATNSKLSLIEAEQKMQLLHKCLIYASYNFKTICHRHESRFGSPWADNRMGQLSDE